MFCSKCGANVESNQKFCPKCGTFLPSVNECKKKKSEAPNIISYKDSGFNKKILILVLSVITVVLLIFAGSKFIGKKSSVFSKFLPEKAITNEDLKGTWLINKDIPGIDLSLQFTSGGNVRLKVGPITLGGNKINYDVVDNNTLYIGALNTAGIDVYFELEGEQLTIDLRELVEAIGSTYNIPTDIISELENLTRVTMIRSKE